MSTAAIGRPAVSVALPVYNAADLVRRAIDSALGQSHGDLEVIVVDNASTDGTPEVVRAYDDPRVRLFRNPTNIGYHRNMNRAVELTTGEYIKFLHADDLLLPTCVERLLERLEAGPHVGLAFACRRVAIADEHDPELRWWRDTYGALHTRFGPLAPVNDGGDLLRRYIAGRFDGNWIGEPSSVMVRRACFERLGLFSTRILVSNDVEMWARVMSHYDVGFVDEELSEFRIGHTNLTRAGKHRARDWLDLLWTLEALASDQDAAQRFPEVTAARRREYVRVARLLASVARVEPSQTREKLTDLGTYVAHRAHALAGRPAPLHPVLAPLAATSAPAATRGDR